MSFKEGVKRKERLCFVGKENRKSQTKHFTFGKKREKQTFGRKEGENKNEGNC